MSKKSSKIIEHFFFISNNIVDFLKRLFSEKIVIKSTVSICKPKSEVYTVKSIHRGMDYIVNV